MVQRRLGRLPRLIDVPIAEQAARHGKPATHLRKAQRSGHRRAAQAQSFKALRGLITAVRPKNKEAAAIYRPTRGYRAPRIWIE
jgi:hypothetical protein